MLEGDRVRVLAGLGDMAVDDARGCPSLSAEEATGSFLADGMGAMTGVTLDAVGGPSVRGGDED